MHLDVVSSEVRGSLEVRQRSGRTYLYDRFRVGTKMKSRYLGEDTPELRRRLARQTGSKVDAQDRKVRMSRLARILKAEGMIAPDRATGKLLLALARAGLFQQGGMLIGTDAFVVYQGELGVKIVPNTLPSNDENGSLNVKRLSIAVDDQMRDFPGNFQRMVSFEAAPEASERPIWKWRQSGSAVGIEFLTPRLGKQCAFPLPTFLGSAPALDELHFLIENPIPALALYRSGVLVKIPRPERFAIYKLMVASRRHDGKGAAQASKDRAQAGFLIRVLAEDRPDDLAEAYEQALSQREEWRKSIASSLEGMPETKHYLGGLA
ncbi:GSU2403 family nucleotidyltransferase fold protein [Paracoccus indicus]|uniref:GSU2403 family nucleotidyltransferase fold protein n=1 Tax=Paracoccus indicus TaxID=2079229 RepID=UPI001FE99B63|nr:GSU2403 family nucleotidyltransferase fold protein [Paracoccus indicus]